MNEPTASPSAPAIWSIGHSTRTLDEFVAVLRAHDIEAVADIRRFPASRRLPQFGTDALDEGLARAGIAYRSIPTLGGRRPPRPDSINTGWRHPAFRGYADYVAGPEFAAGLMELQMISGGFRTAMMCAEVLWWRCHRRIVSDVLTSLGCEVWHITTAAPADRHRLREPAHLRDGVLSYGGD